MVVAAWQTPRPSQVRPLVSVDAFAGHDDVAHTVPAPYNRHAPLPSQNPSCRQLAAPWSEQRAMTSTLPFGMLLQVPFDVVSAQDWQIPVQAVAQQIPCSQKPDRHSPLLPQIAPFCLRPQDPPVPQTAGERQSASEVQVGRQAPTPQRKGKHGCVGGMTQVPAPSQLASGLRMFVSVGQLAAPQVVPDG